ncbi:hypothetical protein [Paenibacillus aceris]|uniref:Uncharacterized protein n=1 Tax=Paenibacillus aceris TaxID=869555 RepID=A0ABS4I4W9_9BACL|nr:hypothetical protein [Paenibacillus aceris]MBP1965954.1 hypothetical protein [Paenibacillus aceris]NHW35049.1 hypothetical protein [Paenibacillus aceris]
MRIERHEHQGKNEFKAVIRGHMPPVYTSYHVKATSAMLLVARTEGAKITRRAEAEFRLRADFQAAILFYNKTRIALNGDEERVGTLHNWLSRRGYPLLWGWYITIHMALIQRGGGLLRGVLILLNDGQVWILGGAWRHRQRIFRFSFRTGVVSIRWERRDG